MALIAISQASMMIMWVLQAPGPDDDDPNKDKNGDDIMLVGDIDVDDAHYE